MKIIENKTGNFKLNNTTYLWIKESNNCNYPYEIFQTLLNNNKEKLQDVFSGIFKRKQLALDCIYEMQKKFGIIPGTDFDWGFK